MVIFSHKHMPHTKYWPWNILVFLSLNTILKPRDNALMRMTKNYFLFFSGGVFLLLLFVCLFLVCVCVCIGKVMFQFFMTIKNWYIVLFIHLTRKWLFVGISIFKRFFYIHANLSSNILRCINVICETKGYELIIYRAVPSYIILLYCMCPNSR